jgi:lipopolysaccharide transport protein LptA
MKLPKIKNNYIFVAFLLFLPFGSHVAFADAKAVAVQNDTNQRAEFKSDLAECTQNKNENVCTYSGQAYFAQGGMKLWAPMITVYRDATSKITKIIAQGDGKGNQGHYHSIPSQEQQKEKSEANSEPVDAQADAIRIYPPKNLMVLEGHAQITRTHDQMSGSYIEYDTSKQTIFTKPLPSELTTIILYPKQEEKINNEQPAAAKATTTTKK